MLKNRFNWICSVLILVSGLVSCSEDKKSKDDEFRAMGLAAQNAQREFQFNADIRSLELGSELVIGSLKDKDFSADPTNFKVNTRCTNVSTSETYSNEFWQKNSAIFKAINLIPEDVLLLLSSSQVRCDFVLTAQKEISASTATTELKNILITNVAEYSFWDSSWPSEIKYHSDSSLLLPTAEGGDIRMSCNSFGVLKTAVASRISIFDLMDEAMKTHPVEVATQNCRILIRNQKGIQLSPSFVMHWPALPLQFEAKTIRLQNLSPLFDERRVAEIKIYNPNSFLLRLKLKKYQKSSVQLQFLFLTPRNAIYSEPYDRSIEWIVENPNLVNKLDKDNLEVEIPPLKEISIFALSPINLSCEAYHNADKSGGLEKRVFAGYVLRYRMVTKWILLAPGYEETLEAPLPNWKYQWNLRSDLAHHDHKHAPWKPINWDNKTIRERATSWPAWNLCREN